MIESFHCQPVSEIRAIKILGFRLLFTYRMLIRKQSLMEAGIVSGRKVKGDIGEIKLSKSLKLS